jgi:uncharacterized coiled-coil DUF342 family protein
MATYEGDFPTRKSELEERLDRLEQEKAGLIAEVQSLREKRTLLDLENKAASLQQTVDALQKEKEDLVGQISSLEGARAQT